MDPSRPLRLAWLFALLASACVDDLSGARCTLEQSDCGEDLVCRADTDGSLRCLPPLSGGADVGPALPDAAGPATDGAVPVPDGGDLPPDAGAAPDASEPTADASAPEADASVEPDASAQPRADGGEPGLDASEPSTDASQPASDGGAPDASPTCTPTTCAAGEVCQLDANGTRCARVSIGAGENHTCAVRAGGSLWCWGRNRDYQVGDGTNTSPRSAPVAVSPTASFGKVVSGRSFSCALDGGGLLYCWGDNGSGRAGMPDATNTIHLPTAISAGAFSDVALGYGGGFALAGGEVTGWGINDDGELGLGQVSSDPVYGPTSIPALGSGWSEIDGGREFACGIQQGALRCWGSNYGGALGDKDAASSLTPVAVQMPAGLSNDNWHGLSVGDRHACALRNGVLLCWGEGSEGQLGNGGRSYENDPVADTTRTWVAVAAQFSRTCAIDSTRALWCWGDTMRGGGGDGTVAQAWNKVQVQLDDAAGHPGTWTAVSPGLSHTCGIQTDGSVWCWGSADDGQLGNGVVSNSASPVNVNVNAGTVDSDWAAVSAGVSHTCATKNTGAVYCWGGNGHGQLGVAGVAAATTPQAVALTSATSMVSGYRHTCATVGAGEVWCWGENESGQSGGTSSEPNFVDVTASRLTLLDDTTLALAFGPLPQPIFRWGDDRWSSPARTDESPEMTFKDLSCLGYSDWGDDCLAIDSTGKLWTFLGDESLASHPPDLVSADPTWAQVSQGGSHACALNAAEEIHCYGSNWSGQLGDGSWDSSEDALVPVTGSGWSAVSAGYYHTCALKQANGALYCWGANWNGEVGDNTWEDQCTPVRIGGTKTFAQVSAGVWHTCAVEQGGELWCWGSNPVGQLGNGLGGALKAVEIAFPP